MSEKLGYYVYALIDPRENQIFYVGKGEGDRVYQHATWARAVPGEKPGELKLNRIRDIHREGHEVDIAILRHKLASADEAYEVEAAIIDALRLAGYLADVGTRRLTNEARGLHSRDRGYATLDDLRARYAAPPIEIGPSHRVVLIRINKLYRSGMTDDELYKATREWWRLSPRRSPDYAFAVYRGIVRAVYKIDRDVGRKWGGFKSRPAGDGASPATARQSWRRSTSGGTSRSISLMGRRIRSAT